MTPIDRLRTRLARLAGRRAVVRARVVLDLYNAAGGGLLASGLAFSALFALLPACLLVLGVSGLFVTEEARRVGLVDALARAVPPLRELLRVGLEQVSRGAAPSSIVGIVGLAWGASRFTVALQDAFGRVFAGTPRRGLVRRNMLGLLSVVALVGAVVAALILGSVASFLEESVLAGTAFTHRGVWRILSPVIATALTAGAVAVVYRFVPPVRPAWRTVLLPAAGAGAGLALVTDLFVYVAPRLIGTAALFGAFAAIFAALAWLSLGFQIVLLGAAWVRVRDRASGARIPAARVGESG